MLIVEIYIYRYIERKKNKLYKDLHILEAGKNEVAPLGVRTRSADFSVILRKSLTSSTQKGQNIF